MTVATHPKPPKAKNAPKDKTNPLDALPDDLRNEIPSLREKIDELTDTSIELRHDIGEKLIQIIDDKSGKYGTEPEKALYKVLPLSADSIRPMVVFARSYNKPEVKRLRDMRNPVTSERLTWTHIIALTRVPNKDKAFSLAEKAINQGWSTKALNKEVIRAAGCKRSGGGRKPKTMKSFAACLTDVSEKTITWSRAADNVWLASGGLSDQFADATKNGRRISDTEVSAVSQLIADLDAAAFKMRNVAMQLATIKLQADAAAKRTQKIAG